MNIRSMWLANLASWALGVVRTTGDARLRGAFDPVLGEKLRAVERAAIDLEAYISHRTEKNEKRGL
jgi:hypothetical protein